MRESYDLKKSDFDCIIFVLHPKPFFFGRKVIKIDLLVHTSSYLYGTGACNPYVGASPGGGLGNALY